MLLIRPHDQLPAGEDIIERCKVDNCFIHEDATWTNAVDDGEPGAVMTEAWIPKEARENGGKHRTERRMVEDTAKQI